MKTPNFKLAFFLIFLLFLSGYSFLKAQITITGYGEVLDNGDKTKVQIRVEAKDEAIKNALYEAFGSIVFSEYQRLIETTMSGRSVDSHDDNRVEYTENYPNGEWIRDINIEYEDYEENGRWWVRCKATGEAVELNEPKIQFVVKTLDGTNFSKNETVDFINGEKGYIFFKAAEDGYLLIFLDDFQTIQRCLPYNGMAATLFPIVANQDYLFFSSEDAELPVLKQQVDEIEFFTEKGFEYNRFYILFSNTPFSPTLLNKEQSLDDGYSTFKTVERANFHSWLQEQRLKNAELQIKTIGITIKGSN
jgi:hypothetical protein